MLNVLEYLERTTANHPEKIALADHNCRYTFTQFCDNAKALSQNEFLRNRTNQAIGVFARHDATTVVLFFSVIYSGNYYVPIDPDLPEAKMQAIMEDAGIDLILGTEETRDNLQKLEHRVSFLTLADAPLNWAELFSAPEIYDQKPLFMVYTSGSTGKPKGVLKSHGAMVSFIEAFTSTFDIGEKDVIGNQTPFSFDASSKDIYLMVKTGATMEILAASLFMLPRNLINYMNEKGITYICWVPTALSIVTQLNTFLEVMPHDLKKVFFVGEVMPMKQMNKWRKFLPDLQYVNLYGASEIAGVSSYYEVQGEFEDKDVLPMGRPMPNCQIYLVDNGKVITEPGQIGEIYYASDALALEYYHDPDKTEASFAMRDFGNGIQRTFKSGDLAQYDTQGNLVFASRGDFQIKHMGHRIELGEIEAVAGSLPEIDRCCCLYNYEKMKITLFCQLASGCVKTDRELRSILKPLLSNYMLPSKVVILNDLPLNTNGKIDRVKLKQLL